MKIENLKFCNCAGCGREMLGWSFANWYHVQPKRVQAEIPTPAAGRILGRPYCMVCLGVEHNRNNRMVGRKKGEDNPWRDKAVRELEDGR